MALTPGGKLKQVLPKEESELAEALRKEALPVTPGAEGEAAAKKRTEQRASPAQQPEIKLSQTLLQNLAEARARNPLPTTSSPLPQAVPLVDPNFPAFDTSRKKQIGNRDKSIESEITQFQSEALSVADSFFKDNPHAEVEHAEVVMAGFLNLSAMGVEQKIEALTQANSPEPLVQREINLLEQYKNCLNVISENLHTGKWDANEALDQYKDLMRVYAEEYRAITDETHRNVYNLTNKIIAAYDAAEDKPNAHEAQQLLQHAYNSIKEMLKSDKPLSPQALPQLQQQHRNALEKQEIMSSKVTQSINQAFADVMAKREQQQPSQTQQQETRPRPR